MIIDVYKSALNGFKYLYVPAGTDLAKKRFPHDFDRDLTQLSPFKTTLNISPRDRRLALDSADVIEQINIRGYAVQSSNMVVSVAIEPPPA